MIKQRRRQHRRQHRQRGQELAEHDLQLGDRRSHQHLHGAAFALLGVNAHRQHGDEEEQDRRGEPCKVTNNQGRRVDRGRPAELRLHLRPHRIIYHPGQDVREIVTGQEQEKSGDDVRDRRNEIAAEFAAVDCQNSFHKSFPLTLDIKSRLEIWDYSAAFSSTISSAFVFALASAFPPAFSSVVSCMKMSSRLRLTARSSSRSNPLLMTREAICARKSAPRSLSISAVTRSSAFDKTSTLLTPLIDETESRSPSAAPLT